MDRDFRVIRVVKDFKDFKDFKDPNDLNDLNDFTDLIDLIELAELALAEGFEASGGPVRNFFEKKWRVSVTKRWAGASCICNGCRDV